MQLYITNDACQPQMDKHNCYFAYSIWLFILTDILYNGDSNKILETVVVRHVLFKDELILKTVAIFVQNAGLIWQQGGFTLNWLQYSVHKTKLIAVFSPDSPFSPSKPFETKLGKQLDILKNNWIGWKQFENLLLTLFMSVFYETEFLTTVFKHPEDEQP